MTQIIYGQVRPAFKGPRTWRNARFFTSPEHDVTAVFLDGEYPAIRAAYEAWGVRVNEGWPDPLDHDGNGMKGGAAEPVKPTIRRVRRKPKA